MDRHWDANGAAGAPAAPVNVLGPNVYPQGGFAPSEPGPWWYHMITEEIRKVITDAAMTPDRSDPTQLSAAIQRMIAGGDYKASVRAATTANLAALSGLLTIDDVVLASGDRVLVKDQTTAAENGVYVASAGAWTRSEDANSAGDLTSGVQVPVEQGTLNADTVWILTTDGAITIGTTALTWQIKSGDASTARKGQVQLATSAEILAGTDALKAVTSAGLLAGLLGAGGEGGSDYMTIPFRDKTTGVRRNLIVQWGITGTISQGGNVAVTFPIAFPVGLLSKYVSSNSSGNNTLSYSVSTYNGSATGMNVSNNSGTSGVTTANWLVIGY